MSPQLNNSGLRALDADFEGELIVPDDESYEQARKVWNGVVDCRPALIARCKTPADVARAIRYARDNDLPLAIRSGGHSVAGFSMCDDGVVADLSLMKDIAVDPEARRVRAGAGVLLAELDAATQEFGLIVPTGQVSHTGIAGADARRRHRMADPQVRAGARPPSLRRSHHGRRGDRHRERGREPRSLLGASWRRRELRRRYDVRIQPQRTPSDDPRWHAGLPHG